jgi:ribonuclease H2 subunit B
MDCSSFKALDDHIAKMDAERAPLAMTSTNSKKKKLGKEPSTDTSDKKRKKSTVSNGVEKLKKVNVEGMAKLSSFFKKA